MYRTLSELAASLNADAQILGGRADAPGLRRVAVFTDTVEMAAPLVARDYEDDWHREVNAGRDRFPDVRWFDRNEDGFYVEVPAGS